MVEEECSKAIFPGKYLFHINSYVQAMKEQLQKKPMWEISYPVQHG